MTEQKKGGSKAWRSEKVRRTRDEVQKFADCLAAEMPAGIEWHIGGSWRRGVPTIGDLDVVIVAWSDLASLEADTLDGIELPASFEAERRGAKVAQGDLVVDGERMHLDFWLCEPQERGAFLWFITGPKELNIAMRTDALRKGMNLSQIGLLDSDTKMQLDDGTEAGVAKVLGGQWAELLDPARRDSWKAARAQNAPSVKSVVKVDGSKRKDGTRNQYDVTIHEDGALTCSCPGFLYRRRCKHSDKVAADVSEG